MKRAAYGIVGLGVLVRLLCATPALSQTSPALELSRYPVWFRLTAPPATMPPGAGGAAGVTTSSGVTVGPDWQGIDPALFDPTMVQSRDFQRWWPQFYSRAYPLGYIPDGVDQTAWAQVQALDSVEAAAQVSMPQWVSIGPAPLNIHPYGTSSGRAEAIAVRPGVEGEWLVGTAQGGLWRTTDGGQSWRNVTDVISDPGAQAIGAVAFASSLIAYAGTGRINADDHLLPGGIGLLKSFDGGRRFSPLAGGMFTNDRFRSIIADPSNPNVVLITVAAPDHLADNGIWKSTDGGHTWTQVKTTPLTPGASSTRDGWATRLEADPANFANQYAGAYSGHLFRSMDAGDSWGEINGPWANAAPPVCTGGNDYLSQNECCSSDADCACVARCRHDPFQTCSANIDCGTSDADCEADTNHSLNCCDAAKPDCQPGVCQPNPLLEGRTEVAISSANPDIAYVTVAGSACQPPIGICSNDLSQTCYVDGDCPTSPAGGVCNSVHHNRHGPLPDLMGVCTAPTTHGTRHRPGPASPTRRTRTISSTLATTAAIF